MNLRRSEAAFIVAVAVLAGGGLNIVASIASSYFFTDSLPDTLAFRWIATLWMAAALIGAGCGIVGIYVALRAGRLTTQLLTAFCVLYCVGFQVDGVNLRWAELGLNLGWGLPSLGFAASFNLVGVGLLGWLWVLRGRRTIGSPGAAPGASSAHAA
jgi:hypothetical protein